MPYCTNMTERPGLVSLAEAARDPLIKYRSVEGSVSLKRKPARRVKVARTRETAKGNQTIRLHLVPLSVAQLRPSIKYRDEGFEMESKEAFMTAAQKHAIRVDRWVRSLRW